MDIIDPIRAMPKDRGWAWMCLLGGLLMNTLIPGAIWKSFGIIFLEVKAKYSASAAVLSWTSSMVMALALFMGAPANALARRFCARWLVVAGGLLAMAGFALSSLAGSMWVFFLTYGVCIGIGTGLAYSPSIVIVGQYFEKKRAFANGVSLAGSGIGSMAIPPLMVYTLDTYGLEGTLLIMGGITLNLCVSGMLFRPAEFYMRRYCLKLEKRRRICSAVLNTVSATGKVTYKGDGGYVNPIVLEDICFGEDGVTSAHVQDKIDKPSRIKGNISVIHIENHFTDGTHVDLNDTSSDKVNHPRRQPVFECRLLTNPILLIYAMSQAVAVSNYIVMFTTVTPHAEQLGFTPTGAALLVSIMGVADIVSRVGVGAFADMNLVKKQHMYHASLALSCLVFCALPSLKTYLAVSVACVLFAVAGGGYFSLFPTLLADALGIERLSTTYGMAAIFVGAGVLTVPTFMGKLRDVTGTWDTSFYACGGLMAAVTFLNLLVPIATKAGQRWLKFN
ncbi:Monocarboxylate transporter 14 [Lamellibrachia satsuma]|nr:Monocarboxylate transporter 14 [Lamellibrachia satsuma]